MKNYDWIIEDVGRSKFSRAYDFCDEIYYLKLSRMQILKRIFRRWKNQRKGIASFNYPPTIGQLFDFIKVANSYFKKEKAKLELLKQYGEKVKYLDLKELEKM